MENNKKNRDLYEIYLELGHDAFEEKIKKPMENYLHDGSNVITINALNTIVANAMEEFKLGEVGFDENDLFSPPGIEEKVYVDYDMPPIYDDYNDSGLLVPPTMESKFIMIILCLLHLMRIIMIATLLNLLPLQQIKLIMLMWRVMILLCM